MNYFQYGQMEIDYLKKRDKKLGDAIDRIGLIHRPVYKDPFIALIESIISQQISGKAAATVFSRFSDLISTFDAENIASLNIDSIQQCGMSMRKANYISGIAQSAVSGIIDFSSLTEKSDEEIIKELTQLSGVGVWTAEMLLIFSLQRPDIVSYKDLAIRRGMMNLYGIKDLTKEKFYKYRKRYSPYGSVASLYLWHLAVE